MIRVKKLYIQDVANAAYLDRFFYYLLNYFGTDIFDYDYMTLNPLRWCALTFAKATYAVFIYFFLLPAVGLPCIIYDAYKMPKRHNGDYYVDVYIENGLLLRELK